MGIIRKTPTSRKDYREIWDYVAERGSPDAADRLLDSFDTALALLSEHPHAGVARPELRDRLRSFPVGNYIIF